MQALIVSLWVGQGILMFFDEFVFHHKRGLKRWERIGHPVDSFFFLLPFLYTQIFESTTVFIALSVLSCIMITKDEFVHTEECEGRENWLHSVLFILHPVALYGLWIAWRNDLNTIINIQSFIILLFMLYQIIYWNFFKGSQDETKG
jgi:hypothetical protein